MPTVSRPGVRTKTRSRAKARAELKVVVSKPQPKSNLLNRIAAYINRLLGRA